MRRLKWEDTLKQSILIEFKDYKCIQDMKNNAVEELMFSVLDIINKEKQRYDFKEVFFSKELEANDKFISYKKQIEEIKINFESNKFINNITRLSKNHQNNLLFKDEMLNSLNIEHFHLYGNGDNNGTYDLLYAMYYENMVYFIDIFNHKNFYDDTIIKILINNWGNNMSLIFLEDHYNFPIIENKERYSLVKNNINPIPYQIANKTVIPEFLLSNGETLKIH